MVSNRHTRAETISDELVDARNLERGIGKGDLIETDERIVIKEKLVDQVIPLLQKEQTMDQTRMSRQDSDFKNASRHVSDTSKSSKKEIDIFGKIVLLDPCNFVGEIFSAFRGNISFQS